MKERFLSFRFAIQGLKAMWRDEPNARIHAIVAIMVIVAGLYLEISRGEWIALIIAIGLVLAAEAFNSAIEYLGDAVTREENDDIRKAKDVAAGAVFICAITAAVIGMIIFIPRIVDVPG